MSRTRLCLALTLLLLAAAAGVHLLAAQALRPPVAHTATVLADSVPAAFGRWRLWADGAAQVGTSASPGEIDPRAPYTEQLVRSYRDEAGQTVMLTLAHVAALSPYTRPHPPEVCYRASGFDILATQPVRLRALEAEGMAAPLLAQHMLAERGTRREAVVYWSRVGALYGATSLASRWHLALGRLQGEAPDGILVRASLLLDGGAEPGAAYALLEGFLADLLAASPAAAQQVMRP